MTKHKQEKCFLCRGYGKLEVRKGHNRKNKPEVDTCPMCQGKGYLDIVKEEK